ncbi:EpsG family protein [Aliarcobacter skirrowii]|uniref:EpsG family protein n=1 Tax=Aliarcobacter skirrowii TaxID=28200 RepID=UPI00384B9863
MITYWILFFSAVTISFLHLFKDTKRLEILFFFLYSYIIIFIAGFKYESIDYFGYQYIYYNSFFSDFSFPFFKGSLGTTGKEYLWATFGSIFNQLGFSFVFWIFLVALLSVSIKFYFFKKFTPYFLLAVVIYILHKVL